MKNKFYPHLFQKGKVGNLTVKNRIIRNSMGTYLANPDCSVTIHNVKAAAEAASGGCGIVFMDNVVIKDMYHMEEQRSYPHPASPLNLGMRRELNFRVN